jgi:flagellar assembly protein FliH
MSDGYVQPIRIVDAKAPSNGFRPMMDDGAAPAHGPQWPHDKAWEEGYRAAKSESEHDQDALFALVRAAKALQPEPSEELAALISETVLRLVGEIVGNVSIDRDQLIRRALSAASLISDCDAARTMWLHPQDLELLQHADIGLTLMPDPQASQGSIRIDCSAGWIEHGTPLYLDALRAELGIQEKLI